MRAKENDQMQELLFIGSTCADVVIRVPFLPGTGEDLHVREQHTALGGCAYNAYAASVLTGGDSVLFSPVGSGVWGEWVRHALQAQQVPLIIPPVEEPNGCCYCLVEDNGERTFLSHHGAEYLFRPEWFELLQGKCFHGIYLCGLEVEEATGDLLIDYLEKNPPEVLYFAPGPRICRIKPERMARLLALHPVLHLNEAEAMIFTKANDVQQAASIIRSVTGGDVVITLGPDGALAACEEGLLHVPGIRTVVQDTIGAGDSHIGALMACRSRGMGWKEALETANRLSALVVSVPGATVTAQQWQDWQSRGGNDGGC